MKKWVYVLLIMGLFCGCQGARIVSVYPDGEPFESVFLRPAGRPHGLYARWYSNGQKEREVNYKHGRKHGQEMIWHSNGRVYRVICYWMGYIIDCADCKHCE